MNVFKESAPRQARHFGALKIIQSCKAPSEPSSWQRPAPLGMKMLFKMGSSCLRPPASCYSQYDKQAETFAPSQAPTAKSSGKGTKITPSVIASAIKSIFGTDDEFVPPPPRSGKPLEYYSAERYWRSVEVIPLP